MQDKKDLPPVRLELTAFRLWDWRAAYCATEACEENRISWEKNFILESGCCQTQCMKTHLFPSTLIFLVFFSLIIAYIQFSCIGQVYFNRYSIV